MGRNLTMLNISNAFRAASALLLMTCVMACDNAATVEIDNSWYDIKLPPDQAQPKVDSYASLQVPPRPAENPASITLSLWLKPLFVDRPEPSPNRREHTALAAPITNGLGLNNLAPSLPTTAAKLSLVSAKQRDGFTEAQVVLTSQPLGSWTGRLLLPDSLTTQAPAILALHGHEQDSKAFTSDFELGELAKAGMVVLAPDFRAMGCDKTENNATTALYEKGLTLMGAHVYETQAMLNYLATRSLVNKSKIGIYSHNAGSVVGHLAARVGQHATVFVGDFQSKFDNQTCGPRHIHCETVPPLLEHAIDINHLASLPMPHLLVEKGLDTDEGRAAGVAFLKGQLLSE